MTENRDKEQYYREKELYFKLIKYYKFTYSPHQLLVTNYTFKGIPIIIDDIQEAILTVNKNLNAPFNKYKKAVIYCCLDRVKKENIITGIIANKEQFLTLGNGCLDLNFLYNKGLTAEEFKLALELAQGITRKNSEFYHTKWAILKQNLKGKLSPDK